MTTNIIKLGGHAMDDKDLLATFIKDLADLISQGDQEFALVHGGGPQINNLLSRLGIKSEFLQGLRKTDLETLAACEMALCGQVNKYLVRRLLKEGIKAIGISGQDGGLLKAEQKDEQLGRVGRITGVDPDLLTRLGQDVTVVIAPLATDAACEPLNVNADTAAGAIAGALKADTFILISDVPGVLDANGNVIPLLKGSDVPALIEAGVISGGMMPKVECCLGALAQGCGQAVILDGTKAHSLRDFFNDGPKRGTTIVND